MRHLAWLNATPKEAEKPRWETASPAHKELVDLDEYEQHLIKLWREAGSVSQGGMSVAPLVWTDIINWANRFYKQDKIVLIPKKTTRIVEKILRGKPVTETETITEDFPVVVKQSGLEDFELEIIMQLSREYCHEYAAASDPLYPCPREIFLDEVDAEENANAIHETFMAFWGKPVDTTPEIVRNT